MSAPAIRLAWARFEKKLDCVQVQSCIDQVDGHKRVDAVYKEMLAKARLLPKHVRKMAYRYMHFLMQCGSKEAVEEYLELDQSLNRDVST